MTTETARLYGCVAFFALLGADYIDAIDVLREPMSALALGVSVGMITLPKEK